jgi:excisionase family DNA binding protein
MQPAHKVDWLEDTYLTVAEAAELLDCHVSTVRDIICRGELPAYQPASRRYRITTAEFLSYLERKGFSLRQRSRLRLEVQSLLARSPR